MKHLPTQNAGTWACIRRGGAVFATLMLATLAQPALAASFTANDIEVDEGDDASFTLELSSCPNADLRWDYATENDTAESGDDYDAKNGKVTFNCYSDANDTSRTITVATATDCEAESDETFKLKLSNFETRGLSAAGHVWSSDYSIRNMPKSKTIKATIEEVAPASDC